MADDTTRSPKKSARWTTVRPVLSAWDKRALLALVKDIYSSSAAARDLVDSRCQPAELAEVTLARYRRKIVEHFFPRRGDVRLKLGEMRQAIRAYRKATGSILGTAELLMTYVESGARFTHECGDIDERYNSSVISALTELAILLRGPARELYPQFQGRLAKVEFLSRGIGWGFHDFIADIVAQLHAELGG